MRATLGYTSRNWHVTDRPDLAGLFCSESRPSRHIEAGRRLKRELICIMLLGTQRVGVGDMRAAASVRTRATQAAAGARVRSVCRPTQVLRAP